MEEDIDIEDKTPIEILGQLIAESEIPQHIELPNKKYKVYTVDSNTASLVYDKVQSYGFTSTLLSFRMYYASRTAPKGFIKFIVTGLFDQWAKWVEELRERKSLYGTKWYEGMTKNYIDLLREELTPLDVYEIIAKPSRKRSIKEGVTSEVAILERIKDEFHNRAMEQINTAYASNIKDLLLLFPECPEHYMKISPEFKHLNNETFKFIQEIKEEALQFYMYKELA